MGEWLSKSESQMLIQHNEFTLKLAGYQATFSLSAGQITQNSNDNAWLNRTLTNVAAYKDEANEWVGFKNILMYSAQGVPNPAEPTNPPAGLPPGGLLTGIIPRWRALVEYIKAHPNYTEAIGQDLGIIGAPDIGALKPVLKARDLGFGQAEVDSTKDIYDGVDIYGQRAGETTWTYLGRDNFPPYVDNRALLVPGQPEERRYRAKFVQNDVQVGDWSDTVSVVVTG